MRASSPDPAAPGELPPAIRTPIPGPRSRELCKRLGEVECPEVTCLSDPPIVWERGRGSNVLDVDGNRFVDLLAGFGALPLGHAPPELARAAAEQSATLGHALSDVFPARRKVELLEALDRLLPGDLGLAILSSSGSDAVESALKTALRVTGRADVVAFEGAYHGMSLGALDATWDERFRDPFRERLPGRTHFVPFGDAGAAREAVRSTRAGAILVEPIQGRAGNRVAPPGFLAELRAIADQNDALLIADEVYSGLGRTGRWLACEHEDVLPDVVALGKALGGGLPFSACAGRRHVMRAWGASSGEAIHTSTHLGNPLQCAVGLRVLELLEERALPERARALGESALERLRSALSGDSRVREIRGRGLMLAVELHEARRAQRIVRSMLQRGWILLAEGGGGTTLSLTPPLTIDATLLENALDALVEEIRA